MLGKHPNGPGQYLFGMVKPKTPTCTFPIDYSAMNTSEEDLEPYRFFDKSCRRSVVVWNNLLVISNDLSSKQI